MLIDKKLDNDWNFSDVPLEKLGKDNRKKKTDLTQSGPLKDQLDKLHTQHMT